MEDITDLQTAMGGTPKSGQTLDPRQQKFMMLYLSSDSTTFANCYQSAINAGFTEQTARNLSHNKPKWYSETLGQFIGAQPEHLLLRLTRIISDPTEPTINQLKAIDMLMKHNGMYKNTEHNILELRQITIESVLG